MPPPPAGGARRCPRNPGRFPAGSCPCETAEEQSTRPPNRFASPVHLTAQGPQTHLSPLLGPDRLAPAFLPAAAIPPEATARSQRRARC